MKPTRTVGRNTLLARMPGYDLGGTLGKRDVIVLRHDYPNGTQHTDYEKLYYALGWGLVKWELYHYDTLIQTSLFNRVLDSAPVRPDLTTACLGVRLPPPPETPPLPGTMEDFVYTLYSCVLRIEKPDTEGFSFWLNDLRGLLLRHTLELDLSFHGTHPPGELIERNDGDVTALSTFVSSFVMRVVGSALTLTGVLVMVLLEDWRVGLGLATRLGARGCACPAGRRSAPRPPAR